MHNICTHCIVFLVIHDGKEERKKKMNKIEIFMVGLLQLDAAHQFLKKASIASRNVDEGVPDV